MPSLVSGPGSRRRHRRAGSCCWWWILGRKDPLHARGGKKAAARLVAGASGRARGGHRPGAGPPPRTAVWLDELQRYFDGELGLTSAAVQALVTAVYPAVVIGTADLTCR
jgi:hypothetical protein